MATVNKNFRIKNGLVVEGSTATVNGQNILVEGGSDSYIIDLIGGQATSANTVNAVVKRDGSGNFSAGTITANLTGNVTGNVTGTVSSLSNHDTDDLAEGNNQYFTDARAKTSAADLLTNANLSNITITGNGAGLTITAENGVAESNTDDLVEGSTNLYFTNTRARQAISGGTGISYDNSTGQISVDNTIATKGYADQAEADAKSYTDAEIAALDTDDIEEGSNNYYFTNGRARNAISGGSAISYNPADGIINVTANTFDAYGAASTAEGNAVDTANDYTDAREAIITTAYESYADGAVETHNDLTTGVHGVTGDVVGTTDTQTLSNKTLGSDLAAGGFKVSGLATPTANADAATKSYVDTAVSNLVDGAPALLDTLNELAAAISDNPNYATNIATSLGEKVAKAGDSMTGNLDFGGTNKVTSLAAPTSNGDAANKLYVDNAQAAAESYADARQTAAETTAQNALDDVLNGTTDFTAVDVNAVSRQIAATTGNIATAAATTALSWAKADYRSAKILVKAKNGSHTHLSELVLTLDTSDNIALNEYAITTTNGSLITTIDADIDSGNVRLRVTPANNNTEVMAHATLLI